MLRCLLCLCVATSLLTGTSATAAVPETLHYQGYLTNAVGDPVHCPDALSCEGEPFDVTFRLYDQAEGGDPLWEETHEAVPMVRGTFDVALGSLSAIEPALMSDPMWLGLSLNGSAELAPRQRLVSAAFALRAAQAEAAELADDSDRLGGVDAAEYALLSDLPGMCVTDSELQDVLAQEAYLDAGAVAVYLTDNGYVPGPKFSGQFADLEGVPPALEKLTLTEDGSLAFAGTIIINAAGEWVGSPTGLQGPPGQDGQDGEQGPPGQDGAPGVGVQSAEVNAAGELVVTLTDGTVYQSDSLIGPKGDAGEPVSTVFGPYLPKLKMLWGAACFLRPDGFLSCWGSIDEAAGPTQTPGSIVDFVAAQYSWAPSSCLVQDTGNIRCDFAWDGSSLVHARGEHPFVSISGTPSSPCALDSVGNLSCWSGDDELEEPSGAFLAFATPISSGSVKRCGIRPTGFMECWGNDGDAYNGTSLFKEVAYGDYPCGIRIDDTIECWGTEFTSPSVVPVGEHFGLVNGGGYCAIRKEDGGLSCWGVDSSISATIPEGQFKQVTVSDQSACALSIDNVVHCWGKNYSGELYVPATFSVTGK